MKIRCCQHLSMAEIDSIKSSCPVLIVGSAVSDFIPTNLPSGGSVANDLLELLARSRSDPWPDWLFADAKQLPFEAVLEAYPEQDKLPEIICRLFGDSSSQPNSLHAALGESLAQGLFSALITTNYDLAFDNYFAQAAAPVFTIYREEQYRQWTQKGGLKPPYWKIHGNARPEDKDTIVFNLAHERRMDDWKQELLERIVRDRTTIFLGYSGRDFDICPEIGCIKTMRGAVWLRWKWVENAIRGLNANQARVLHKASGTVVIGDLHSFIGRLCSRSLPNLGRQNSPIDISDYFDLTLLPEWRVRILDRLACPRLGIPLLNSLPQPESLLRRSQQARMFGHSGDYGKAARVIESQIVDASDPKDRLTYLMDAANAWYVYGSRLRSKWYFRRARRLAESIGADDYQRACLSKIALMYVMRTARYCSRVPFPPLKSWIRERASRHYNHAGKVFERTSLDNLYIVQNDAERIGVANYDGFASAANLGFVSLGLRGMQCLKERDRIMALGMSLEAAEEVKCLEWLDLAKHYGWNPEVWKWAWILLWQGRRWNRSELWRDWFLHFRVTEYSKSFRCITFLRYFWHGIRFVVPNRGLMRALRPSDDKVARRSPGPLGRV